MSRISSIADRNSKRKARETAAVYPSVFSRFFDKTPEYERIYAIGDIHGEFDLFIDLLDKINCDNKSFAAAQTVILLLGDLIDRGPKSRQVLQLLQQFHTKDSGLVVLLGNHEELLLESARGNETAQRAWLRNGGRQTLESYGIAVEKFTRSDPFERASSLVSTLGGDTLAWLTSRPLTYRSGDYYFCHAGIRPGVELSKQSKRDLLAIGSDFLSSDADHGAMIVHGHTEVASVECHFNHIAIDTAAYRTGKLSALGLQGSRRWQISATREKVERNTELLLQV